MSLNFLFVYPPLFLFPGLFDFSRTRPTAPFYCLLFISFASTPRIFSLVYRYTRKTRSKRNNNKYFMFVCGQTPKRLRKSTRNDSCFPFSLPVLYYVYVSGQLIGQNKLVNTLKEKKKIHQDTEGGIETEGKEIKNEWSSLKLHYNVGLSNFFFSFSGVIQQKFNVRGGDE